MITFDFRHLCHGNFNINTEGKLFGLRCHHYVCIEIGHRQWTMNLSMARANGKIDAGGLFFPLLAGHNLRRTKNDSMFSGQPVNNGPDLD